MNKLINDNIYVNIFNYFNNDNKNNNFQIFQKKSKSKILNIICVQIDFYINDSKQEICLNELFQNLLDKLFDLNDDNIVIYPLYNDLIPFPNNKMASIFLKKIFDKIFNMKNGIYNFDEVEKRRDITIICPTMSLARIYCEKLLSWDFIIPIF